MGDEQLSSAKNFLVIAFIIFPYNACNCSVWANPSKIQKNGIIHGSVSPVLIDPNSEIVKTPRVKDRPTIALALGGGGIRGVAHIGVLRVLQKEGIPIDYIAGCSMGSIVGGLYCTGVPLDDIEKLLVDGSLQKAFAPGCISLAVLMMPLKYLTCTLTFQERPYAGLFDGKKFRAFIAKRLPEDKKLIENTNPPFAALATNLLDGKAYKLAKGDLADCIVASSAISPIVRPVEIHGKLYVDGGISSNLPVISARQFGADIVIAVPVDEILDPEPAKKYRSVRNVVTRIIDIVISIVDEHYLQNTDLVIMPDISHVPIFTKKTKYIKSTIKAGENATYAALPAIREAIKKSQLKISSETVP